MLKELSFYSSVQIDVLSFCKENGYLEFYPLGFH